MASYSISNLEIGAHAKTLVANTVDTVTFANGDPNAGPGWSGRPREIEILSNGSADIYVVMGDAPADPTVAGASCWRIPALPGSTILPTPQEVTKGAALVVKLISAGTPTYSVARAA